MTTASIWGYASLFDVPDLCGDMVSRGAFLTCLHKRSVDDIKMLYQHNAHDPIGVWTHIVEDDLGLRVVGEVNLSVQQGSEAYALLEQGALTGLSIGFNTVKARRANGGRELTAIDLWEISLVTFPMLPGAQVTPGHEPNDPEVHVALQNLTRLMRV